ncbi:MAG: beta-ketoacyl-[acyl-carrier-protein] synthase family protein [Thermodesulfobacteriota bacterium]|nr:beta-ketoacyl-[acyl-carrier-protein] synthase family protein [Thermodesulfobacteriota bacterium]
MKGKRIVITGAGLITPLGVGIEKNWEKILSGNSGIGHIRSFETSSLPMKTAGEVKDFFPKDFLKKPKLLKLMNRTSQFAVAAATLAIQDACLGKNKDFSDTGLVMGTSDMQYQIGETIPVFSYSENSNYTTFGESVVKSFNPIWPLSILPNMSLCHIAINHDLKGPSYSFSSHGIAGSQAIGEAFEMIEDGTAKVVLAGGADTLNLVRLCSYYAYDLLSKDEGGFLPFSLNRSGMVIGEGAGFLVLEELSHAKKRGIHIYAEILGYKSHIKNQCYYDPGDFIFDVSIDESVFCMDCAMKRAGVNSDEIDLVIADAKGLYNKDRIEALAIEKVFKKEGVFATPFITNFKTLTGYLLNASGPVELIFSLLCIKDNVIPPMARYMVNDPEFSLNLALGSLRKEKVESILLNTGGLYNDFFSMVIKEFQDG